MLLPSAALVLLLAFLAPLTVRLIRLPVPRAEDSARHRRRVAGAGLGAHRRARPRLTQRRLHGKAVLDINA
jgi:hypothetical protein